MSFTRAGGSFTSSFTKSLASPILTTLDPSYYRPLFSRITIKDRPGRNTLYRFDPFDTSDQDLIMPYCDMDYGVGENGVFNLLVSDPLNVVDQAKLHFCKVFLELGKTPETFQQFLVGYGDIFELRRPVRSGPYQEYLISGIGSGFQAAQLYIHMRKAADVNVVDQPNATPNPKYNINNIIEDSFTSKKWRPLKDISIENITGWDLFVDPRVNTNFPVLLYPMTYYSDFLTSITDVPGAQWFVDMSVLGKEILTVTFDPFLHTGITIKTGEQKTEFDDANRTAYVLQTFSCTDDATPQAGCATRLYSVILQDSTTIAQVRTDAGKSSLNMQALGQQFIIDNDQRRMDRADFKMSKVGDPDSPNGRVNGLMIMDDGNNQPRGQVLDEFSISLNDIETKPKFIPVDLDPKIRFLEGGQNKVWFVFTQRSGKKGQPINDPANTIFWHHDSIFNQSGRPLYSALTTTAGGDKDKIKQFVWNSRNTGPNYCFDVYSDIKRMVAVTNDTNQQLIGLKEALIDPGPLVNPAVLAQYMSVTLAKASKARRNIPTIRVRVPNNFLFRPYQWVNFTDGKSINQEFQVQRARYAVSALPDEKMVGCMYAEIQLGGLYNPLVLNTSCDV